MMEQALKMEVRPFTCYLATQVFYLAIQGGLIFAFFFFPNNSSHSTLTACLQFLSSHRELTDVM